MFYPLLSEYIDAILSSGDNLAQLNYLRPVLDKSGRPVMSSGNFAVVFKMKDDEGRLFAMKCFLRDQKWRADNYRLIANRLKDVCSPYFIEVTYYERELFVDSKNTEENEFPVLLMDWVDGITLNEYLRQIIDSRIKLSYLAYSFSHMSSWLLEQDFAHGDIKPDNILVKEDGSLVLIDYDGMFVPDMGYIGYPHGDEIGSPGFRHPLRSSSDFSSRMDDFSLIVILLSLRIIANDPSLWIDDGSADKLVFSESDFLNPLENSDIAQVYSAADKETRRLFSLFLYALATKGLKGIESKQLELSNPFRELQQQYQSVKTRTIYPDGLIYSADHKCLLDGTSVEKEELTLLPETLYIADYAFKNNTRIKKVSLPNGLLYVGSSAFSSCKDLRLINLPDSIMHIDSNPFYGCESLQIDSSHFNPTNHCFVLHETLVAVIANDIIDELRIPKSVSRIGYGAFSSCKSINRLIFNRVLPEIPDRLGKTNIHLISHDGSCPDGHSIIKDNKLIGFSCDEQMDYCVPATVTAIGNLVFHNNKKLKRVTLPPAVTVIGHNSFLSCENLESITFPNALKEIGTMSFCYCKSLVQIFLPDSLEIIGAGCFIGCVSLKSIRIPHKIKKIDNLTFKECDSLESVELPESLEYIYKEAFMGCKSLKYVSFNSNLWEIRHHAFANCERLSTIKFTSSDVIIHETAFENCPSLKAVSIPSGTLNVFKKKAAFANKDIVFIQYF